MQTAPKEKTKQTNSKCNIVVEFNLLASYTHTVTYHNIELYIVYCHSMLYGAVLSIRPPLGVHPTLTTSSFHNYFIMLFISPVLVACILFVYLSPNMAFENPVCGLPLAMGHLLDSPAVEESTAISARVSDQIANTAPVHLDGLHYEFTAIMQLL